MLLKTSISDFDLFFKNKQESFDCKQILSQIIPNKISVQRNDIEIDNGTIIKGILSKTNVGAGKNNSLIHLVWDSYGHVETANLLDNLQRVTNHFNYINGFTVGIGDIHTT